MCCKNVLTKKVGSIANLDTVLLEVLRSSIAVVVTVSYVEELSYLLDRCNMDRRLMRYPLIITHMIK